MNRPWMPLYVADYRADTAHLNAAQHGAYLLLIMHYWQTGNLPSEDEQLARITCMTPKEWKRARPVIVPFFAPDWKHKRIEFEMTEAARISAAGRQGGLASGKARRQRLTNDRSTIDERSFNDPPNDPPTNGEALQSQSQRKKKEPSLRSGAKSKTRMPEDWQPTEADRDFAAKLGMRGEEIEAEIPRCRDHFRATGQARADWSATWRNWCRKHLEIANGGANGRQKPDADAGRGGLAGTLAKLKEHVERVREGAEDRSGEAPPRLLSYGGG